MERTAMASKAFWRQVAKREVRTSSAWAPLDVRLPPLTLRLTTAGRMACSAGQLGTVRKQSAL